LWGITCSELDADFAAQRIKKLSLYEAIKSSFFKSRTLKHKTLVDRFAYPKGGTGMIYDRMAQFVTNGGGKILLNSPVRKITPEGQGFTLTTTDGQSVFYDQVISSMPLTLLLKGLPDVPEDVRMAADNLTYRN